MANLMELAIKIGAQDNASGVIKNVANTTKSVMKGAAVAIGAVSGAIVAMGKIGMDYNMQMESYTTNFTTMLGSTEDAVKKVEELKKFAASTPLSMDDLAKGTQTLLAFGVQSDKSTETLRMLGDIALGNADKMQSLANSFGKASATGKLTGEIVQQMIAAGWNPLLTITERTGESMAEVQKRMSAGKISAEELEQAMADVTSGSGKFAGGMEAASHTTAGLISTLTDNAKALVGEVFEPISAGMLERVLPIALDSISALTDGFRENGIQGMIDAGGSIIKTLIGEISNTLPELISVSTDILGAIVDGIIDNLPTIVSAGVDIAIQLATGLIEGLPHLIEKIPEIFSQIVSTIEKKAPEIKAAIQKVFDTLGIKLNVDSIVETFSSIIKRAKELAPLIMMVVTAITTFKSVVGIIELVKNSVVALKGGFVAVNAVMAANPIAIVIAALAALAAFLVYLWKTNDQFRESVIKIWNAIKEGISAAVNGIVKFFTQTIPNAISNMVNKFAALPGKIGSFAHDMHTKAVDFVSQFINGMSSKFSELVGLISGWIQDNIITPAQNKIADFVNIGSNIVDNIRNGISAAWDGLTSWFNNIWNSLFGDRNVNVNVNKTESSNGKAIGMDYVPFNGYPAMLHQGEAVLTRSEAEDWRRGNNSKSGITIVQNISAVPQTPVQLAMATNAAFERARWTL